MPRLLRWIYIYLLLLPSLASLAQGPPNFKLQRRVGTLVPSPLDVVVAKDGYVHLLDGLFVNRLNSAGGFVKQIPISNPTKPNSHGHALSVDEAGNYYVADLGYGEVRKFSPDGKMLLSFSSAGQLPGHTWEPNHVRTDAAGNIYVSEQNSSRVQKFDGKGKLQWAFDAVPNPTGVTLEAFGLDIDAAGNVYVLEPDFAIIKISATGQLVQRLELANALPRGLFFNRFSLTRSQTGEFYVGLPQGQGIRRYAATGQLLGTLPISHKGTYTALSFDAAGHLYATSLDQYGPSSKLYKFTPTGALLHTWGNLVSYNHLIQDRAGNFCVLDELKGEITKFNAAGQVLFRFGPRILPGDSAHYQTYVMDIAFDWQNNIYALETGSQDIRFAKYSPQGKLLKIIRSVAPAGLDIFTDFALDPADNIYVLDSRMAVVHKLNQQGQQLLQVGAQGRGAGQFERPQALAVDGRGQLYVPDINGHRVQKFSPAGELLREYKALTRNDENSLAYYMGISVDSVGTVYMGSSIDDFVQVYTPNGTSLRLAGNCSQLAINHQGNRLLKLHAARSNGLDWPDRYQYYSDVVSIYNATVPFGREGHIMGHIFQDQNFACNALAAPVMADMVVVAEPGPYYGYTDENGNYTINADTGRYTVRQLLPTGEPGRTIQQTCATQPAVQLAAYDTTVPGPDFGNHVSLAPYLRVEVGSNRRRRCFRNLTSVRYANTGFATARAAQVAVKLPGQVVLISASAPYARDARGNYLFSVGDLAPQQSGQITITDSVACGNPTIRGLTVCTQAWITPANSYPPTPAGSGGAVAVRGQATPNGQVRFALVNQGRQATGDSLGLRVFADAQLALNRKYALAAGDSLILRVPAAAGQALRLEADQPAGYPLGALAAATVEAAGPRPGGLPNPAVFMLPPAPTPPTVAEDCQPIVDSFDPNDKQVRPTGTGAEHNTPPGAALRYQLRFQNTGTDLAYRVEVVDTLSADLDLRTLRVGAASHPYRLSVTGKTRPVLTFAFDSIMLPERNRDEAGSNGFVQFSIRPKADVAPKTTIENFADIFFDYNEPVRTNTTANRIYDAPPVVDLAVALRLADVVVSPQLTSFAPAQGPAGTVVTLRGQRFAPTAGANQVSFNGVAAAVLSAAPGQLTVRVPPGAASGRIRVVTAEGGTQSRTDFQVGQATPTRPAAPDALLALYPNPAPGGAATLAWRGADFAVRQVQVFDGRGAQVLAVRPASAATSLPLPLAGKPAGLYLVLVHTSRGLVRRRLTAQ